MHWSLWALVGVAAFVALNRLFAAVRKHRKFARYRQFVKDYQPPADCFWSGKRFIVLVNPYGGDKTALQLYHALIKPLFAKAKISQELVVTKHAAHPREVAVGLDTSKYDAIVSVSGDGMLHEIVNGLCAKATEDCKDQASSSKAIARVFERLSIGLVSAGSSNGFAMSLGRLSDKKKPIFRDAAASVALIIEVGEC